MRVKRFRFPFMVADAEKHPEISWRRNDLELTFTTWQGERARLLFTDVEHFELIPDVLLGVEKCPIDGVVELVDSELVKQVNTQSHEGAEPLTHIVIGFNCIGSYLGVIFREMKVLKADLPETTVFETTRMAPRPSVDEPGTEHPAPTPPTTAPLGGANTPGFIHSIGGLIKTAIDSFRF